MPISESNFVKFRCDTFDPNNITFRSLNSRTLYPMHRTQIGKDKYVDDPIIIETPYVTLQEYPVQMGPINREYYKPKFRLIYKNENQYDMSPIFALFSKLDEYSIKNLRDITREYYENIPEYVPCIKYNKNRKQHYVNFSFNLENDETNQIKMYYKSDYKDSTCKIHELRDLNKILRPGQRVRFILSINKLWMAEREIGVGYGIKIMQIEYDNTCNDKYKLIKSLKNNEMNMFDKSKNHEKYAEYLRRTAQRGPTKFQKKKANSKIIEIIDKSASEGTGCIFDDVESYVPYEPCQVYI
jgi:hypothetical protein